MLGMSWSTFRNRWPVFVGAIVTVCLGVALVQSSLLTLISAATAKVPAGLPDAQARALSDGYVAAVSLLGITLGLGTFVAVFIVSSTFAFTVAQRRRDLALLRLTGASRGQVRRLLLGEAVLLGCLGSALGIVAGLPVARLLGMLLARLDFVPSGFVGQWRSWIVAVSVGVGLGVAVVGVLVASRRASRVRPLEALRDTGQAARVMTASRWVLGVLFLAGSLALMILVPAVPFEAAVPLSINLSMVLVIALAALAPLVVPLVSWPLGLLARGHLAQLAQANLRSGTRRSASIAAPIMLLVAFAAGTAGTQNTIGEGTRQEISRTLRADLVLSADRPVRSQVAAVDGVAAVSEQAPVAFDTRQDEGDGQFSWNSTEGLAVDPAAYLRTHRIQATAGNLTDLHGATIAASPTDAPSGLRVGDTLQVRIAGRQQGLRVVALLPETLAGPNYLLSAELMPRSGTRQYLIQVAAGTGIAAVASRLAAFGAVATVPQWIRQYSDQQQTTNLNVMLVLVGMAMLYTVIAMVNAVVIGASDRGSEFAAARLAGLTRAQVVRAAVLESLAVVAIGLLLGGVAATGTVLGMAQAVRKTIGVSVVAVPWSLLGWLVLAATVLVSATSALTTIAATRTPAIQLVDGRE
ncbi:MAG: FtsX-like permease family protein [Micromonosporaceae bacterium]|nr:FtsX-like permease family protein [Micromonosporaceae bacterium]